MFHGAYTSGWKQCVVYRTYNSFETGVLLANGSTVCIPKVFADDFYTFSTTTHTYSKLSVTVPNKANKFASKYAGGMLLPTGDIMMALRFGSAFKFNPGTPSVTTYMDFPTTLVPSSSNTQVDSVVLTHFGALVFVPYSIHSIVVLRSTLFCLAFYTASKTENVCLCGPGYTDAMSGKCVACPADTYQSGVNLTACLECPDSCDSAVASTTQALCVCREGYYSDPANHVVACEACAAPKYTDRTVTCGNVTTMRKCRHYTPYSSWPPASTSKSDCICDAGAFPWTPDGTCIQCARGMHKPS